MGKKILLFEGGKTNSIDETIVEEGLLGIQRILNHFHMKNFKLDPVEQDPIIIKSSKWLRAPLSGVFHAVAKNGQYVEKGEVIGLVSDPYGSSERKVKSNAEGYVICTNEAPLVNKGDAIFHIGSAVNPEKITPEQV